MTSSVTQLMHLADLGEYLECEVAGWVGNTHQATVDARRAFTAHLLRFNQRPTVERLLALLEATTVVELAVARSMEHGGTAREATRPHARAYLEHLLPLLAESAELQLAAAWAASGFRRRVDGPSLVWMRQLLLGTPPRTKDDEWEPAVVPGIAMRDLADVIGDVAAWLISHDSVDGLQHGVRLRQASGIQIDGQVAGAWVAGYLDEALVRRYLLAMLALDWAGIDHKLTRPANCPAESGAELNLLSLFATGRVLTADAPDDLDQVGNQWLRGFEPRWVDSLRRDDAGDVAKDALQRFQASGSRVLRSWEAPGDPVHRIQRVGATSFMRSSGPRILAGLLAYGSVPFIPREQDARS